MNSIFLLLEIISAVLGPQERRRLELRQMGNEELFRNYDNDLVLRLHNEKNLSDTRKMLGRFEAHLAGRAPSPELGKEFLAPFVNRKSRTLYRYAQMIKGFMRWYPYGGRSEVLYVEN